MQRHLGDPSSSDSFVVTSLRAAGMSMRKLLTLVSLALVLVVVIGGTGYLLVAQPDIQPGAHGVPSVYHPLPTYTPLPISTPVPLPSGWRQPVADQIQSLAFAPSAPNVGYACDLTPFSSTFFITQDSGQSWQKSAGPDPHPLFIGDSGICSIAVNPYNPQEVVAEYAVCSGRYCPPTGLTWKLARSFDGGQHWQLAPFPSGAPNNESAFSNILTWTSDSDLFVGVISFGGQQSNAIAMSANGAAFTWTANHPTSPDPYITNPPVIALFGLGTTLYAGLETNQYNGGSSAYLIEYIALSHDHGAHWAAAQQFTTEQNTYFENIAPNEKTLVAYHKGVLQRSDDGGATWLVAPPLPDAPQLILDPSFIVATPDGGFIAEFAGIYDPYTSQSSSIPNQVYIAHPGATSWRHVVDLVDPRQFWQMQPATVTVDGQGRPTALWGLGAASQGSSNLYAVEYPLP